MHNTQEFTYLLHRKSGNVFILNNLEQTITDEINDNQWDHDESDVWLNRHTYSEIPKKVYDEFKQDILEELLTNKFFIEAEKFVKSAQELNNIWGELTNDMQESLTFAYPFSESFDDVASKILHWYDQHKPRTSK